MRAVKSVLALVSFFALAACAIDIHVDVPERGYVSMQIRDKSGEVVGNAISPTPLEKGRQTVRWDLTGPDDGAMVGEGTYTYKAVWIPEHTLNWRGCFYPTPLPDGATPWSNPSGNGGWTADHFAPKSIVRCGDFMYITAMCEAADGLIKCDKDLNKVWGTRQWVFNTPFTSAADGGFYYGFKNGVKKVCADDNKTSVVNTRAGGESFAVIDGRAYFSKGDAVAVWDFSEKPDAITDKPIDAIPVPKAGQIRRTPDKKLMLWSGKDIVRVDPATKKCETVIEDAAEAPGGFAIREDGVFAVGDCGRHVVTVYGPDAKPLRTLGKGGRRPVGPWDEDTLEDPYGIEFGPDGRLWICEQSQQPKRVGVWNIDTGHCEKSVVGPTNYGGGGTLDPDDAGRAFWGYLELRRGADGKYRPDRIFFRPRDPLCGPWGGTPTYAFRARGKLWFTDQQNVMGNGGNVLYVYEDGHARAVAAWGSASFLANAMPEYKGRNFAFSWTDLNDDGKMSADELVIDEHVKGLGTGWVNRVNENFDIAFGCDGSGVVKFSPVRFTDKGWPVYGHLGEPLHPPFVAAHHQGRFASSHMVDASGNIMMLSKPLMSVAPDGKVNFRYRNRWPSLHDSHETTEDGRRLGELIGTTRFWGATKLNDSVGEIVCFNSNLGCAYLMTADGIFLAQLMQDQRCGLPWNQKSIPDSDTLKKTSMQDEHFLGQFQRTKFDGRDALAMVCGKTHASVIEIGGLEGARRLADGRFAVTAADFAAMDREAAERQRNSEALWKADIAHVPPQNLSGGRPPETLWNMGTPVKCPNGDTFRLMTDDRNLYYTYTAILNSGSMKNSGKDFATLFETGGAFDLMLQTDPKADPMRRTAAKGDIRLIFAEMEGKVVCVKYDYCGVGDGKRTAARVFQSPVGKVEVSSVTLEKGGEAWFVEGGGVCTLRAVVPMTVLGASAQPAKDDGGLGEFGDEMALDDDAPAAGQADISITRGDCGRFMGDAAGTVSINRRYWCNQATALMSDRPTLAGVDPSLWGMFSF